MRALGGDVSGIGRTAALERHGTVAVVGMVVLAGGLQIRHGDGRRSLFWGW